MPTVTTSELQSSKESQGLSYKVLRAEDQQTGDGTKWSQEWMLSTYLQCTDGLIGKMDGTIPLKDMQIFVQKPEGLETEKRDLPPPDAVIYLDKSARPVSWMVHEFWQTLAREPGTPVSDDKIPEEPKRYFLNIDKEPWLERLEVPKHLREDASDEKLDYTKIDREQLARIRALYSTKAFDENQLDEVWNTPTILDGQHVMIVDEVMTSGLTLQIAQRLLSMAIPEATFSAEYWTKSRVPVRGGAPSKDGRLAMTNAWVPVWYSEKLMTGRGIGNRIESWADILKSRGMPNRVAALGRHVLSTPPHNPATSERITDTRANNLREDFKQMVTDLESHKLLYRPSADRPLDTTRERIEGINGCSFDVWKEKRDKIAPKKR